MDADNAGPDMPKSKQNCTAKDIECGTDQHSTMVDTSKAVLGNHCGWMDTTLLPTLKNHWKCIFVGAVLLVLGIVVGWYVSTHPPVHFLTTTQTPPPPANHTTTPLPPYDVSKLGNGTLTEKQWNEWHKYQDNEMMALPDCHPVQEEVIVEDEMEESDTWLLDHEILTVKVVASRCHGRCRNHQSCKPVETEYRPYAVTSVDVGDNIHNNMVNIVQHIKCECKGN